MWAEVLWHFRRGSNPLEDAFLFIVIALAGLLAFVGGLLWFTGQLAALWHARQWLDMTAAETLATLFRFVDHLDDPAGAWPPAVQPLLPGPIGFYATLAAVLVVLVALLLGVITLATALRERRDRRLEPDDDAVTKASKHAAAASLDEPVRATRVVRHRSRRWRRRRRPPDQPPKPPS